VAEVEFGRYHLIELLGRGGMGEVWRARDSATNNRTVAIKVLPPHLAGDAAFVARFRREADAAAQLNNPHIIPIHNYGEIEGRLYVDMRLIEGRDLQQVLADGPLEPGRAVRIIEQVAKALHAAHKIGLVHRDVKPSNILIDEDDFAYLIDFGIARGVDQTGLTGTGGVIGSWPYMSPERLRAGQVDARSDIYALACVLYECLAGSTPFPGDTFEQQMTAHLMELPPRVSTPNQGVSANFDAVIATGMAKDPRQRYGTTVQLAAAARSAITSPIPPPVQPPSRPPQPGWLHGSVPATAPDAGTEQRTVAQTPPLKDNGPTPRPHLNYQARQPDSSPQPPQPRRNSAPRPWWGRPTVMIPAAIVAVVLVATGVIVTTVIRERPTSDSRAPTKSTQSSQSAPANARYGPQTVLPFTGLNLPYGVATAADGTVYVADNRGKRVLALAPASSTPIELPFIGLSTPGGVALDSLGSVYVTDYSNNRVLKLERGSSMSTELPFRTQFPTAVAVDRTGSVYVTEQGGHVRKTGAGTNNTTELPFADLNSPTGIAVDDAGNVYVVDQRNRVLELPNGSSTPTQLPFNELNSPWCVAVDSAGSVYVTDGKNNQVWRLASGSKTATVLPFTGLTNPDGVAVDNSGSVIVTDAGNNRVMKLPAA
jgi:serine/threonine-protein kinase